MSALVSQCSLNHSYFGVERAVVTVKDRSQPGSFMALLTLLARYR